LNRIRRFIQKPPGLHIRASLIFVIYRQFSLNPAGPATPGTSSYQLKVIHLKLSVKSDQLKVIHFPVQAPGKWSVTMRLIPASLCRHTAITGGNKAQKQVFAAAHPLKAAPGWSYHPNLRGTREP
jgi:hypothetical protein